MIGCGIVCRELADFLECCHLASLGCALHEREREPRTLRRLIEHGSASRDDENTSHADAPGCGDMAR